MSHRGPDDCGEWWSPDGRIGLAHRRLSIFDLSAAGHQPMSDATGALHVVFNGEIYNFQALRAELAARGHAFRSASDTEVLLAAYREWDVECLRRLNGMFAFALYDARRDRLFLARDRVGEKPLFYRFDGASLRFSSELKGLLADRSLPRQVDWPVLDCILADGFAPADRCVLLGFDKLPPAHGLTFELESGMLRSWRYWQPPRYAGESPASEGELLDALERLLEAAVSRQLAADVPVGVLLSGGVDSSLMTAMAARSRGAVKTFTVRFPGYEEFDESAHARLIADTFGTQHVEIDAEQTQVQLLPHLARQFDEPMIDSSMLPTYLVSRAVREHCTVALGGDGGDELFGGYPHYDRMLRLQRAVQAVPRALRLVVGRIAGELMPAGSKGRNWAQAVSTDFRNDVPLIAQLFDALTRSKLMRDQPAWKPVAERLRLTAMTPDADLLQRATRLDFRTYLSEDLLVKVDRASMLSSLEVRAPMLDTSLLEFAFGAVPSHLKATATGRKILLKRLAARVLPPAFDQARKQGFSIPLSSWLRAGPWREYFKSVLFDTEAGWFQQRIAAKLLDAEGQGRTNGERLFALVMIELWRREYGVEMVATRSGQRESMNTVAQRSGTSQ